MVKRKEFKVELWNFCNLNIISNGVEFNYLNTISLQLNYDIILNIC